MAVLDGKVSVMRVVEWKKTVNKVVSGGEKQRRFGYNCPL